MIVVFGSINLDIFFRCGRLPATGETLLCDEAETAPGGKGANQALAAARDGTKVHMVGAVGRDPFADEALGLLTAEGVDLSALARGRRPTACATIAVLPNGENAIVVGSGANLDARADLVPDDLMTPETWLLLQMEAPYAENWALVGRAKRLGAKVLLNLAPAGPVPDEALRSTDLLVVNEVEAEQLLSARDAGGTLRKGLAELAADHVLTVVMTLGARGLEAFTADGNASPSRRRAFVQSTPPRRATASAVCWRPPCSAARPCARPCNAPWSQPAFAAPAPAPRPRCRDQSRSTAPSSILGGTAPVGSRARGGWARSRDMASARACADPRARR